MAQNDKITRKDIIEDKVFQIGKDYAKSLDPAILAQKEWLETMIAVKQKSAEFFNIQDKFKISPDRAAFLSAKQQEEAVRKATAAAIKLEQEALAKKKKVDQEELKTKKAKIDVSIKEERAKQALLDTEKKQLDLEAKKQRAQRQTIKLTAEEKLEIRILNRNAREAAVISSKLSTEYEKQATRLIRLKREYKDVALREGEASKQAKAMRAEIQKLDSTLKRVDAGVGEFQRNVGNYSKAMQGARNAARSLASAMGLVGGAFLIVQVVRDASKVIRDFEKANATLSAILQVEKEDMRDLTEDAQRLGETTVKTAGQVTELQIAYARLGFQQNEILDLTEATIAGSIAMNAELDRTANLTGAVVNTFEDLSTTDAPKIIDIMALATAKSALNFEKLETGIPIVAGAADAAGVSFTRLVALMGKLADSGIDVSTSSTSLRNIFIESAAQGDNYEQILERVKNNQDKLTASNDEFGKRAAVSAAILSKNIDTTKELDEALQGAAGTAERMANKELDTLDGSLKLLRSAFEGYILDLNDASGAGAFFRDGIRLIAENFKSIIDTIALVVGAWIAYKVAVLTARLQQSLMNKTLQLTRLRSLSAAKGINLATLSWRKFTTALKANALFLVIAGITTLIALTKRYNQSLSSVAQATGDAAKATAKQKSQIESLIKVAKNENISKEQRIEAIEKLNSLAPEYLGNITLETINTKESTKAIESYIEALDKKALAQALEERRGSLVAELVEKDLKSIEEYKTSLENLGDNTVGKAFDALFGENSDLDVKNREELEQYLSTLKATPEAIDLLRESYLPFLEAKERDIEATQEQIDKLDAYTQSLIENGKIGVNGVTKQVTENKEKDVLALQKLRGELAVLKTSLQDLTKNGYEVLTVAQAENLLQIRKNIQSKQAEIDAILGVTKANKKAGNAEAERLKKEKKLRDHLFKLREFELKSRIDSAKEGVENEILNFDIRRKYLQEQSQLELELAELTAKNKFDIEKKFTDQEIQTLLEGGQLSIEAQKRVSDEELLIIKEYQAEKAKIQDSENSGLVSLDVAEIKSQVEQRLSIKKKELEDELRLENEFFHREFNSLEDKEFAIEQHEKRVADIKLKYAKEGLQHQITALEALVASSLEGSEARIKAEEELATAKRQLSDLTTDKLTENDQREVLSTQEKVEQILSISSRLASAIVDLANAILDAKIQALDEELEKNDEKYERYLETENLSEEQRQRIEKKQKEDRERIQKEKEKLLRRQAVINKAQTITDIAFATALGIMQAYAQTGPIAGTIGAALIAGIGAIQTAAVIATPIPQYFKGTENHPGGLAEIAEYRPEVVIEPGKKPYVVSQHQVVDLPRGTEVVPSLDDYKKMLRKGSIENLKMKNDRINNFNATVVDTRSDEVVDELRKTRKAIESKRSNFTIKQEKPRDMDHEFFRFKNTHWN